MRRLNHSTLSPQGTSASRYCGEHQKSPSAPGALRQSKIKHFKIKNNPPLSVPSALRSSARFTETERRRVCVSTPTRVGALREQSQKTDPLRILPSLYALRRITHINLHEDFRIRRSAHRKYLSFASYPHPCLTHPINLSSRRY